MLDAVRHQQRIAWISNQRREALRDTDGPLDDAQQHYAAI
jgi:hypothetical protein